MFRGAKHLNFQLSTLNCKLFFPVGPRWSIWKLCVLRYSQLRPLSGSAQAALSPPHRFIRHIQFTLIFYHDKFDLSSEFQYFFVFFLYIFCCFVQNREKFPEIEEIFLQNNQKQSPFSQKISNSDKIFFSFCLIFPKVRKICKKIVEILCEMVYNDYGHLWV